MSIMFARQAKPFFVEPCNSLLDPFDQPPADFDATVCPIIGRHFFGLRPPGYIPQGRRLLRQLGPGERAAARELRRRGVHLRIIEGGTP